jgi:peroxiredoxin
MAVHLGDRLPEATFYEMTPAGPKPVTTSQVFGGKRVALFAVPAAFSPTCSSRHLPEVRDRAADLFAHGVDEIVCVAVNDVFVLAAWAEQLGTAGRIRMLSDGNGEFSAKVGVEFDASGYGMGRRSFRYSMLIDDGVVKALNVEPDLDVDVSSAAHLVEELEAVG